jgi:hypothetical protein
MQYFVNFSALFGEQVPVSTLHCFCYGCRLGGLLHQIHCTPQAGSQSEICGISIGVMYLNLSEKSVGNE